MSHGAYQERHAEKKELEVKPPDIQRRPERLTAFANTSSSAPGSPSLTFRREKYSNPEERKKKPPQPEAAVTL
jgi:hypothetical protein